MKKIFFILFFGLILGCSNEAAPVVNIEATVEARLEEEKEEERLIQEKIDQGIEEALEKSSKLQPNPDPDINTSEEFSWESTISSATKSVVKIIVQLENGTSSGSGVIIETDYETGKSLIITNHHVIYDWQNIEIITHDKENYAGKLIGQVESMDLALIEICCNRKFHETKLAPKGTLSLGQDVRALGYPLNTSVMSVTGGLVSKTDDEFGMIQTDAVINSGNSGGPLITKQNEIIGINTSVVRGESTSGVRIEGVGFAVPSHKILNVLDDMKSGKYVSLPTPTPIPASTPTPIPA